MLLQQMIDSPVTSSNLVVFDPFAQFDREALVKEVIGLANAKVDGPRAILFGVNPGGLNGSVVGIPADAISELKKAHRLVSSLVEPLLELAFIFDSLNGKLVGALEIDGCEFGPYFVAQNLSDELQRGGCWIREDRELRKVERHELMNGHAHAAVETPTLAAEDVNISVGFSEDPDSDVIEIAVPDTSNPPFAEEDDEFSKTATLTQAIKDTVSTVKTQILGMKQTAKPSAKNDGQADVSEDADKLVAAAKQHYYYEERAVQLDLSLCNKGEKDIPEVSVELGFPRLPGFDIADRLHTSPFDKRSEAELAKLGYPTVTRRDDAIKVRSSIELLEP